jgi:hypothetical protein
MGLDMYLSKKTYVKNWSHMSPEEQHKIVIKKGGKVLKEIKPERISNIEESVAYWRKANHIHQWFVENVQDGDDNCRQYYVSREQLQELVDVCKKVKESLEKSPKGKKQVKVGWRGGEELFEEIDVYLDTSVADELLQTQPGFFFGGTEYDEYYIHCLDETIKQIEPLLKEDEESKSTSDYYYQSSW